VIWNYGMTRADTFITGKCMGDSQEAYMDVLRTRDLYALGKRLVRVILDCEYGLVSGYFNFEENGKLIRGTAALTGLPFELWSDALPHCADAIRKKKVAGEEDLADVLQCKRVIQASPTCCSLTMLARYLLGKERIVDAISHAKRCVDRSPEFVRLRRVSVSPLLLIACDHRPTSTTWLLCVPTANRACATPSAGGLRKKRLHPSSATRSCTARSSTPCTSRWTRSPRAGQANSSGVRGSAFSAARTGTQKRTCNAHHQTTDTCAA
jgi:hypothetical protein